MNQKSYPSRRSTISQGEAQALRSFAPNGPGLHSVWTTGAKDGIGTAYYNPDSGVSCSNVWYTLSAGTLTEVYYPDVSCANLRMLQLIVSDGHSFTDVEETDTTHEIELVVEDALIYRQINTAKSGKYKIEKTYITDPVRHSLLMEVTFTAMVGTIEDYQLYVYSNPTLKNRGMSGSAEVMQRGQRTYLVANAQEMAMVLAASCPILKASSGYLGTSDGRTELQQTFQLSTLFTEALNGNVAQIAQLDLLGHPTSSPSDDGAQSTFAISLGFGIHVDEAIEAATATLGIPFAWQAELYRRGWQAYLQNVQPPVVGSLEQYYVAVMVLKAHEDKQNPGAIVASLTIPWGERVSAEDGGVGGYHLVWSRDFYQVASTLLCLGIQSFAKRALAYLDEVQQQPNGSFPQNSWLDGTPYWRGLQMDQVAFPILLADQLGDSQRFTSLVKPAADFLIQYGPYTPQERWEENAGYSPSTIAAEIAALVVAAKMANIAGDFASAGIYLATADAWAEDVNQWTVVKAGEWSSRPYYIRISDTKNPDDHHWIEIKNGGGWRKKSEIVDAGFLELVRLGIIAADDERVVASLDVIDEVLKYEGPYGPVWKRYNHDGYGEQNNGEPYYGVGVGRPWPLLTGERGEYEVAFAQSAQRFRPKHLYGAKRLLLTMAQSANQGFLIPEQIWDHDAIPEYRLHPGQGTGSATPLAWAMAQYIRLAECIRQGRVVEMPTEVEARYLTRVPPAGPPVRMEWPLPDAVQSHRVVTVIGYTSPGSTLILQSKNKRTVTTATDNGRFEVDIELQKVGPQHLKIITYDNQRSIHREEWPVNYQPRLICEFSDAEGDDRGPGGYTYPTHADFIPGDFDLRHVRVSADDQQVFFEVQLGHLDNPWEGPSGISKQLIDVYLHNPHNDGQETHWAAHQTFGLHAQFEESQGWHRLIRATGNWQGGANLYDAFGEKLAAVEIDTDMTRNIVQMHVPISVLGGVPGRGWGMMVIVTGEEDGHPRPIRLVSSEWDFGGGGEDNTHPLIMDMLDVPDHPQSTVLTRNPQSPMVLLPMRWI